MAKELEVEAKLQSKIDRLFKRFFQIKAMKQMAGLGNSKTPSLIGYKPVLELTVANAMKSSEK